MDFSKLGNILKGLGSTAVVIAIVWWVASYHNYFKTFGVGRCISCLFSSSTICKIGSGLTTFAEGTPSYKPAVFWVGASMFLVGFIIKFAAKE